MADLHEPETLAMLSAYVLEEQPTDADSPLVFLIGGRGKRRLEAFSYGEQQSSRSSEFVDG